MCAAMNFIAVIEVGRAPVQLCSAPSDLNAKLAGTALLPPSGIGQHSTAAPHPASLRTPCQQRVCMRAARARAQHRRWFLVAAAFVPLLPRMMNGVTDGRCKVKSSA